MLYEAPVYHCHRKIMLSFIKCVEKFVFICMISETSHIHIELYEFYVIMEFDVKIRSEEKPKNKYQVFCSIPPYVPLKENKFISSIFNFFSQ